MMKWMLEHKRLSGAVIGLLTLIIAFGVQQMLAHTDVEYSCDAEFLVRNQQLIHESLNDFEALAERDLAAALLTLYDVAQNYEAVVAACGFEPPEDVHGHDEVDDHADDHSEDEGETDDHSEDEAEAEATEMAMADDHDEASDDHAHTWREDIDFEAAVAFASELGDPEAGAEIFNTPIGATGLACSSCHLVDSRESLVGPGLQGVAYLIHAHAEDGMDMAGMDDMSDMDMPVPEGVDIENSPFGLDAYHYLYQSIVDPSAVLVEGYPDNVMPKTFGEELSAEQLNDLIAYLMTLTPPEDVMEAAEHDDDHSEDEHMEEAEAEETEEEHSH